MLTLLSFITLAFFFTVLADNAKLNAPAPNFKLKDKDGNEISLSQFKGKIVVLEWINFDCPYVKKHYNSNNMQKLQEEFTQKGVVWIAINSSAPGKQGHFTTQEINERINLHKAKFNYYLIDEDGKVGRTYGAATTPHLFIIDKDGILVYAGGIDDKPSKEIEDVKNATNFIHKALNELLSGQKVSIQSQPPYGCSVKYAD
ncbi:MAG TPA: thioredoxin family protein [Ignavibacteriales bacterium]|jgi:peroxiredoxin|nr:thioredoxin family protein [Ignavibacteriales bacterium]